MLPRGKKVLERYVIEDPIGNGAVGEVYRARHERLGFPVAIKILLTSVDADKHKLAARFEREAELMAKVRHPNVVSILDFGLADDLPCIAMELIEGETLSAYLQRSWPLHWSEAVRLTLEILAGLEAIHAAEILHRDLKPANVMLTRAEPKVVKLLDFGIARSWAPDAKRLTNTGKVAGTPAYMSPEQLMNAHLDVQSDLYSAAIILYELVQGSLPFAESKRLVTKRLSEPIPAPHSMWPIPAELEEAILKTLSLSPDHRPASAKELAEVLRAI
jgi:eukaryotic-like serine/threonine-protein kinase